MVKEGPCGDHPDVFTRMTIHVMMLTTMGPHIIFARLRVVLTCWIVAELLRLILVKIEFHSHPLSVGSHAKKGTVYPTRKLNSMVPSYTTKTRSPPLMVLDARAAASVRHPPRCRPGPKTSRSRIWLGRERRYKTFSALTWLRALMLTRGNSPVGASRSVTCWRTGWESWTTPTEVYPIVKTKISLT